MNSSPELDPLIQGLIEAVRQAPENLALRLHLAEMFLKCGKALEAEHEFRAILNREPSHAEAKAGLANTFFQLGKYTEALVLTEDLASESEPKPSLLVLHSRLLYQAGEVPEAVVAYKRAITGQPGVADAELEFRLGLNQGASSERDNGRLRQAVSGEDLDFVPEQERSKINFSHVGGMEPLKEEIRMKIIHPLTHQDLYKAYGKPIGGGILLYGPPGCGKTWIARATAGEIQASFYCVGINDILEMWIGNSERNLHNVFEQARATKPAVLFFDEVDALGASRSDMKGHAGRQLINQFLSEMDGAQAQNDGVLILGATNAPWHLDSAFRRPGRFDRILFVPPPDTEARAAILELICRERPTDSIDYRAVAKKAEYFSGADLKALVDVAVEKKLQEAFKSGKPTPLQTKDLLAGVGEVRPSTREWFATARNYALFSNQGGAYDDILKYLKL